ncbi:MAG: peptide deformylase [Polyangiaceae bacterium]
MAIRKIAQLGEPVLRQRAAEVPLTELGTPWFKQLVGDLIETMRDADGAGLAAPQIFESIRVVAIEVRANPRYPAVETIELMVLVNPRLTPLLRDPAAPARDETMDVYEGCLSVAGLRGRVTRPRKILVEAMDPEGNELRSVWEGFRAVVVQHECDHLDGKLFVDRADTSTLTFLREFERFVPASERVVDYGSGDEKNG